MKTVKMETHAGQNIHHACSEAVKLAKKKKCNVEFEFNEQKLTATPTTVAEELVGQYKNETQRRHDEYVASPQYKQQQEEYARAEREKNSNLESALKESPKQMTLKEPKDWETFKSKNSDPYGMGVVTYSERWARLMEGRMAKGEKIAQMAEKCSHLADNEGITGFMYGCAVSVLSKVWIHGEALRLWHNRKSQIGTEGDKANESGGVLNPAILSIGS